MDEVKLAEIGQDFKKSKKILKYINKVFDFKDIVKNQKDFRKKQHIQTQVIFTILFWAFLFRVKSFNHLEQMIKYGCFKPLFPRSTKMPSIDAISDILTVWNLEKLQQSFEKVIKTLYNKKTFKDGTISGYTVCAIDGTDVVKSSNKKCNGCSLMKNGNGYHYAHKSVVAMIIGKESNYVLNFGMSKVKSEELHKHSKTHKEIVLTKSEGELTVSKDLISKLPSWVNVIVGDALYFNAPFIKTVLSNGKHSVIRIKDQKSSAYKEIEHKAMYSQTEGTFVSKEGSKEINISYWVKDTYITDASLRKNNPQKHVGIRVYKFIEVIETNIKGKQQFDFKEVFVGTTDKNMPPKTVWEIIRKRWYIENTCFHQLKTHCFMEHCFRHENTAIKAILGIMFLGFNIIQSFLFKRTKKFKESFRKKKESINWYIKELEFEFVILAFLIKKNFIPCSYLETS